MASFSNNPLEVPREQRAKVNAGVLKMIRGGAGPDRQQVFTAFTGKGGLHGLTYGDHANRHAFTQAKQALEQGQFFTPDWVCKLAATILDAPKGATVCDPTCGHGAFFNHFPQCTLTGSDIDQDAVDVAAYLYPNATVAVDDIRSLKVAAPVDFIVGNPPFGLRLLDHDCSLRNEKNESRSEDVFIDWIKRNLRLGGSACFVVPTHWPTDELLYAKTRSLIADAFITELEILLPVTSFRKYGCVSVATKLVLLRTRLDHEQPKAPVVIDGSELTPEQIEAAWHTVKAAYLAFRESATALRARLTLAQSRAIATRQDATLSYRFKKQAFHLAVFNPKAAQEMWAKWAEAHKPKPPEMDFKIWDANRLKPETAIAEARRAVRAQYKTPKPLVRLSFTKRGFSLRSHSPAAAAAVRNQAMTATHSQIAFGSNLDLAILKENLSSLNARKGKEHQRIEFKTLNTAPVERRIRREFSLWQKPLAESATEGTRAAALSFYESLAPFGAKIEPLQIEKLAQLLAKPAAMLSWQQGCGKTFAAVGWTEIKRDDDKARGKKHVGATVIVASSLAVRLQWLPTLKTMKRDAIIPSKRSELSGDLPPYIVLTHHLAMRLGQTIKRLAKRGLITQIILDESDEIANREAIRTRAILDFSHLIRHRLVSTGTPARNNAAELFTQLDFIFGGSPAFYCAAKTFTEWNSDAKMTVEKINPDFRKSYRSFKGMVLFRASHAPQKPTVLGEQRSLATVAQKEGLSGFLAGVRSRMRIEELLGYNPLKISTTTIYQTKAERALYKQVLEETRRFIEREMEETDNNRKANQLALAQAIRILQQTCSIPAHFPEYSGDANTSKRAHILNRCQTSDASHIAVGTIWKEAALDLVDFLQAAESTRQVFLFTGDESFNKRKDILAAFQAAPRAVLVTTQQSLRSSINVHAVSEVIAEALPWNFSALEQWGRRFVRYNNVNRYVTLEILVCHGTLEERILGLLLRKENVAQIAAGDEECSDNELFDNYGIEGGELALLLDYLDGREDVSLRNADRERKAA